MKKTLKGCAVEKYIHISSLCTAFERVFDKNFSFHGETHDFWEFVCVVEGVAGVLAGEEIFRLESGQAILHRPMEFHRIWSEEGTRPHIVIVTFAGDIRPVLKERRMLLQKREIEGLAYLISQADIIFERESFVVRKIRAGKELEANLFVSRLENILMTACSRGEAEFAFLESTGAVHYQRIVKVLSEHLSERLTLADVAELCKISESSVKKTFTKYAGMGMMTYFNEMKMRRAIRLMEEGASVAEAAEEVGFSDHNYFSTVFKRTIGLPPREYILKRRNNT